MKNQWTRLWEDDNIIVEKDMETENYRISYFEDNHYKDEIIFVKGDVAKYQ